MSNTNTQSEGLTPNLAATREEEAIYKDQFAELNREGFMVMGKNTTVNSTVTEENSAAPIFLTEEMALQIPVITGYQGGYQGNDRFYLANLSLIQVVKFFGFFSFSSSDVDISQQKQRGIDQRHANDIGAYLLNTRQWVLPPLVASLDATEEEVPFIPTSRNGIFGMLKVPMAFLGSRFYLNDGQHRRVGIDAALKELQQSDPGKYATLAEGCHLPVMLFRDPGLSKAPIFFSVINRTQKPVPKGLAKALDKTDQTSQILLKVARNVPFFTKFIEFQKGGKGKKLFNFNNFLNPQQTKLVTQMRLLGYKDEMIITNLTNFWKAVYNNLNDWQQLMQIEAESQISQIKETIKLLTADSMTTAGGLLNALSLVAFRIFVLGDDFNIREYSEEELTEKFAPFLDQKFWRKKADHWIGRCAVIQGDGKIRLLTSQKNIRLMQNTLLEKLGIQLTEEDLIAERKYKGEDQQESQETEEKKPAATKKKSSRRKKAEPKPEAAETEQSEDGDNPPF